MIELREIDTARSMLRQTQVRHAPQPLGSSQRWRVLAVLRQRAAAAHSSWPACLKSLLAAEAANATHDDHCPLF